MARYTTHRDLRQARHSRIRRKLKGTMERPRLSVFRSNKSIYAQVIDDASGHTLVAASSRDLEMNTTNGAGTKTQVAYQVGLLLAKRAQEAGIALGVFDRGGYRYHGRVKSLAEGVREGGVKV
ncbi:MAG: 50S ribosomal protein L18 [SAR202 cluster bacterium Io17-Chloro-G3]|nr:MAG: 50S ribosomal protein L18 [SAR202 cluster bacterium Io17-Chloro-G3]